MVKKALFLCLSIAAATKCCAVHFENVGTQKESEQTSCCTTDDVVREIPADTKDLKISGTMRDDSAEVLAQGLEKKCPDLQVIDLSETRLTEVTMFQNIVSQPQFQHLIVQGTYVSARSIEDLRKKCAAQDSSDPEAGKNITRKIIWLYEGELEGMRQRLLLSPTSFRRHKEYYATRQASIP